jgi:hypothetical protein
LIIIELVEFQWAKIVGCEGFFQVRWTNLKIPLLEKFL